MSDLTHLSDGASRPADDLVIEPWGYDVDGSACYDEDLLDLRWSVLLDDVPESHDLEAGWYALVDTDDVDLIRRGVEVLGLLAERHIRRLAFPGLLDEESGMAWHRSMRVADLRAHRERYEVLAEKVGWPSDPGDLDDNQLGMAVVHVLAPHLLDSTKKWERPEGAS